MDENKQTKNINSEGHLPPPSLEVKVRTMASDLESLSKGGGLLGLANSVSVSLPDQPKSADSITVTPIEVKPSPNNSKILLYVILIFVGLVVLFSIGYFLPSILKSGSSTAKSPASPNIAQNSAQPLPSSTPSVPDQNNIPQIAHRSFFSAISTATTSLVGVIMSTSSFAGSWQNAQKNAPLGFSEIFISEAKPVSFSDFLTKMNIGFSNSQLLTSNFEPDFTSFVYKKDTKIYPGYILKLKSGLSPLLIQKDLRSIENEADFISKVFTEPTVITALLFKDSQIMGQPVREFVLQDAPRAFVYGWFRQNYLIIGTSEQAVSEAAARL